MTPAGTRVLGRVLAGHDPLAMLGHSESLWRVCNAAAICEGPRMCLDAALEAMAALRALQLARIYVEADAIIRGVARSGGDSVLWRGTAIHAEDDPWEAAKTALASADPEGRG